MRGVRVAAPEAEHIRQLLMQKHMLSKEYTPFESDGFVYFPVDESKGIISVVPEVEFVDTDFEVQKHQQSYLELLEGTLSEEEYMLVPRSFDVIGSIAIIDLPGVLDSKDKLIGDALTKTQHGIVTVLKKEGIHSGEFRTQKLAYVAGKDTRVTIHKENNVLAKLDVEEVYFSPRLATERKRIASQVTPGEDVLVMFSGCGIYALVISKNTDAAKIVGIEKNPVAHRFAEENLVLNRVSNIEFIEGDVRDVVPGLHRKFDRIVMPLPKQADLFLSYAFDAAHQGTIIHLYMFLEEGRFEQGKLLVKQHCSAMGLNCEVFDIVACGQYSPSTFRCCVDFRII
jgi:tRNA (guanine37-N1)-methyltransferase